MESASSAARKETVRKLTGRSEYCVCHSLRSSQSKLLLAEQNVAAADQIVQLPAIHIDQLIRLVPFAAKIKIAAAFLIEEGIKPLEAQVGRGRLERGGRLGGHDAQRVPGGQMDVHGAGLA